MADHILRRFLRVDPVVLYGIYNICRVVHLAAGALSSAIIEDEASGLPAPKPMIGAVESQQLGMRAVFDNDTLIKHENAIEVSDR